MEHASRHLLSLTIELLPIIWKLLKLFLEEEKEEVLNSRRIPTTAPLISPLL